MARLGFERKSYSGRDFFPNIIPGGDQLGTLFDKGVRPPGILVGHVAGHRVDVAPLLQSATRGDASSAIFGSFDHEHTDRETADDPVADRKVLRCGESGNGEFGNQGSARGENLLAETGVFLRINNVNSGAKDGDGFASARGSAARARPLKITGPRTARSQARRSAIPVPYGVG